MWAKNWEIFVLFCFSACNNVWKKNAILIIHTHVGGSTIQMTCGYIQSDYHEMNSNELSCLDWRNKQSKWKWWTRYSRHRTSIESVVKTLNAHNHYCIISHIFALYSFIFRHSNGCVHWNWKSLLFVRLARQGQVRTNECTCYTSLIWWLLSPEQSDHLHRYGVSHVEGAHHVLPFGIMAFRLSSTCNIEYNRWIVTNNNLNILTIFGFFFLSSSIWQAPFRLIHQFWIDVEE